MAYRFSCQKADDMQSTAQLTVDDDDCLLYLVTKWMAEDEEGDQLEDGVYSVYTQPPITSVRRRDGTNLHKIAF